MQNDTTQNTDSGKGRKLTKDEIKNLLILEIVSLSPYEEGQNPLNSKERREVFENWKKKMSWHDVFLPIRDIDIRKKYTELFEAIDKNEELAD